VTKVRKKENEAISHITLSCKEIFRVDRIVREAKTPAIIRGKRFLIFDLSQYGGQNQEQKEQLSAL
jgi:hypothetical protein